MKKTFLILSATLILAFSGYAHNGKIGYALPTDNIKIDGDLSDWSERITKSKIENIEGEKLTENNDFDADFRVAYSLKNKSIYLALQVVDNSFTEKDTYQVYLNAAHLKRTTSVAMLAFTKDGLKVLKHSKSLDPIHQFLDKKNVEYKISNEANKKIFEIKINLQEHVQINKTLGIDFFFIDADKDEKGQSYINWGEGSWKEYLSGRLGDVILLKNENLGKIEGKIKWKEDLKHPLLSQIKISSTKHSNLWVNALVDKEGNYSAQLPAGEYNISSPFKVSSPLSDFGYDNQFRIDDNYKVETKISSNQTAEAETLSIPTFKPPTYLFEDEGILHNYDSSKKELVDNFIETYRQYYNVPGASVALIKDGEVVYYNVFGVENALTQKKVDGNTLFQAASVTKPVFAFMVMRLAERGLIDLDKPLYQYLPFGNIAEDERYKLITARLVLTHQTGLPNWAWGGPLGWKSGTKGKLLFKPGEKFGYSGEAFEYLGRVVEHLTKKDLNQLLKEEVIQPLEMQEMYFVGNEKLTMANGHIQQFPTFWGQPYFAGTAFSMLTEAKTFSQFAVALTNKKGLSEKTYESMFNRRVLAPGFPPPPNNSYWNLGMGLGFFVQDTPYGKAVMHGGSNGDFQCEFVLYPKQKMGFIIFTNSNMGHKLGQELGTFLINGNRKYKVNSNKYISSQTSLSGTWDLFGFADEQQVNLQLKLTQKEKAFSGKVYFTETSTGKIVDGRIEGNSISGKVKFKRLGKPVEAKLKGEIEAETLKITIEGDGLPKGNFVGKKI